MARSRKLERTIQAGTFVDAVRVKPASDDGGCRSAGVGGSDSTCNFALLTAEYVVCS